MVAPASVELPTHQKTFAASIIEGRIANILVEPGQKVRAGEVLAEIDSQQLRNLQLDLLQAQAKLKWTENSVRRLKPLADKGYTAAKELWRLETDLKNLRQSVSSLTRKLSFVGLSSEAIERISNDSLAESDTHNSVINTLPIRAPSDGWVAEFDLVPGEIVRPHDRLFEINDLSTVWVEGYVFEEDATYIRKGQHVVVSFSAQRGLRVKGTVVRLAPSLNSKERVLRVWIELETSKRFLREGMFARIEISVQKSKGKLAARQSKK